MHKKKLYHINQCYVNMLTKAQMRANDLQKRTDGYNYVNYICESQL